MSKITINAKALLATFPCVSTESTRYYLNGVSIERSEHGGIVAVSTNGHTMSVYHDPNGSMGDLEDKLILNLNKTHAKLLKQDKAWKDLDLILSIDTYAKTISNISRDDHEPRMMCGFDGVIDGTFPDWKRVVPDLSKGFAGNCLDCFNADYLKSFADLGKVFGGKAMDLAINEHGRPSLVRFANVENWFGVLMPMRDGTGSHNPRLPKFMQPVFVEQLAAAE